MSARNDIVVFGGSGFMGSALVSKLIDKSSRNVVIVDNQPPRAELLSHPRVAFVEQNILGFDKHVIAPLLVAAHAVVFKIGRLGSPLHATNIDLMGDYLHTNALSLKRLLDLSTHCAVPEVVVDSSITVLGDLDRTRPIIESDKARHPSNFYGLSKALLEDVCHFWNNQSLGRVRLIRYPRVYSPEAPSFLKTFAAKISRGEPIEVVGDAGKLLDLVHIDDAIETAFKCIFYNGNETVFHASYGDARSVKEIIDLMLLEIGEPNYPVSYQGEGNLPREGKRMALASDHTRRTLDLEFKHSIYSIVKEALKSSAR